MTPQSSQLLVDEILPLLTRNVPSTVYPYPGEDTAELIQDGVAIAADMMELMEKSGKLPIASSIAYYSIMRLRSGRRSYGSGLADVLSPQAQMAHSLTVTSLDAPLQDGKEIRNMMTWLKRAWTKAKACLRYSRQFWPKASQAVLVVASLLASVLASMIQMLMPFLLLAGFLALWAVILSTLTPETAAPRVI